MGALLIGIGKRGKPSMPPPERNPKSSAGSPPKKTPDEPDADDQDDGDKLSPDKAMVVKADSHCVNCMNYHPDTGECDRVAGVFEPDDACWTSFKPMASSTDDQNPETSSAADSNSQPNGDYGKV